MPAVVYLIIFQYLPFGGLLIAFKDYNSFNGIFNSPWTSMGQLQRQHRVEHEDQFERL